MLQSLNNSDKSAIEPKSVVNLLLITILDTSLRAFVPTIGGTFLGVGLDHLFHTAPWCTVVMIPVGFIISGILIILQLRSVKKK